VQARKRYFAFAIEKVVAVFGKCDWRIMLIYVEGVELLRDLPLCGGVRTCRVNEIKRAVISCTGFLPILGVSPVFASEKAAHVLFLVPLCVLVFLCYWENIN